MANATAKKTLKLGGKRFSLSSSHRLKRDAKKAATGKRNGGKNARTVASGGKWRVYTRG